MTSWTRRPRTRRRRIAAVAFVGAIVLSGCTFHPGQAAVVNGSNISQSTVDDLVHAGCSFFEAQRKQTGGAAPATSTAYLRHLFTQNLISFKIIDKAASELHLSVSPAVIAKATSGQTLPASLNSKDRDLLEEFFANSARQSVLEATIGAHLKNPSVTNADHVTPATIPASRAYLTAFTAKQHVAVNPAYGTWHLGHLLDTDESLSGAQSSAARRWLTLRANNGQSAEGLPPSQVCG